MRGTQHVSLAIHWNCSGLHNILYKVTMCIHLVIFVKGLLKWRSSLQFTHLNSCSKTDVHKTSTTNSYTQPNPACVSHWKKNADSQWHCKNQQQRHSLHPRANSARERKAQQMSYYMNYCSMAEFEKDHSISHWNCIFKNENSSFEKWFCRKIWFGQWEQNCSQQKCDTRKRL